MIVAKFGCAIIVVGDKSSGFFVGGKPKVRYPSKRFPWPLRFVNEDIALGKKYNDQNRPS
jgi:hypothetical protein